MTREIRAFARILVLTLQCARSAEPPCVSMRTNAQTPIVIHNAGPPLDRHSSPGAPITNIPATATKVTGSYGETLNKKLPITLVAAIDPTASPILAASGASGRQTANRLEEWACGFDARDRDSVVSVAQAGSYGHEISTTCRI
jgi:hypothetical protein